MNDPRLKNLAEILVNYSVAVKPGDWVMVHGNVVAMPLVNEVMRAVLRAGGNPSLFLNSDDLNEITLSESSNDQLQWVPPIEKMLVENVDVRIDLIADSNTRTLTGIDPAKQRLRQMSRRDLMQTFMKRSAEGSLRWTLTNYPCHAFAQEADMSLSEYENFVYSATFADQA